MKERDLNIGERNNKLDTSKEKKILNVVNLLRGPRPRHQEKWRFPSKIANFNPLLGLITKFNWTCKVQIQRHNKSDPGSASAEYRASVYREKVILNETVTTAGSLNSLKLKKMAILPCLLMNTKSAWLWLNHPAERTDSAV